jgi:type IV pilus assembly protein PilA
MNAPALEVMGAMRTMWARSRAKRRPDAIRATSRGFTLVELMMVVTMVGVLATLALVAYKRQLNAAHAGEAKAVIQAIRAAEEVHKAETLVYLGCSAGYDGANYYPQGAGGPNDRKWNFRNPAHPQVANWDRLHVSTDGPVIFAFAVVAGGPGEAIPPMSGEWASPPAWPAVPPEPWYVIQATGNLDYPADNIHSLFVVSSLSGELYSENETE